LSNVLLIIGRIDVVVVVVEDMIAVAI